MDTWLFRIVHHSPTNFFFFSHWLVKIKNKTFSGRGMALQPNGQIKKKIVYFQPITCQVNKLFTCTFSHIIFLMSHITF